MRLEAEDLSPEEEAFVQSYLEERPVKDSLKKEIRTAKRERRNSYLFWVWLSLLAAAPFILSGIFLFQLNQYYSLLGSDAYDAIQKTLTPEEIDGLAAETGIADLNQIIDLYNSRGAIVAIIFTVFIGIIAFSLIFKMLLKNIRRNP